MASREKLLKAQIAEGQKELLKLTADARRSIEAKIISATKKGNFAQAASVRDGLYKGIAKEYVALNGGLDDWTKQRSTTVSKAWHTLAIDDLPKAASGSTFGQFSKKYLDDIVGKINPSTITEVVGVNLNPQVGGMLAEDIRAIRTAVSNTIRTGALTGMTNPELSAEMQRATQAIKPAAAFVDKAGRKWSSDSYFGMLNRTLHTNVARETYNSTVVDAGFDLVRVEGTSGDSDSPCRPYEGEILSLTGQTKGYTTMAEAEANGLHHPNCIHTESVYIPELTKAQKDLLKSKGVGRTEDAPKAEVGVGSKPSVIDVVPFVPAKTIDGAEEIARGLIPEGYKEIKYIDRATGKVAKTELVSNVSFKSLSVESANDVVSALHTAKLAGLPLPKTIKAGNFRTQKWAMRTNGSTLEINSAFMKNSKVAKEYAESLATKTAEAKAILPKMRELKAAGKLDKKQEAILGHAESLLKYDRMQVGDGSVRQTALHELGHVLDSEGGSAFGKGGSFFEKHKEFASRVRVVKEEMMSEKHLHKLSAYPEVARFTGAMPAEVFAESFLSFMIGEGDAVLGPKSMAFFRSITK